MLYQYINKDNNETFSVIFMMYFFSNLSIGIIRTINLHNWCDDNEFYFRGKNNLFQSASRKEKVECYFYLAGSFLFQYLGQCVLLILCPFIFKNPRDIQWMG